jgi:hypothetical protein
VLVLSHELETAVLVKTTVAIAESISLALRRPLATGSAISQTAALPLREDGSFVIVAFDAADLGLG